MSADNNPLAATGWKTMRIFWLFSVVSVILLEPKEILADEGEMVERVLLRQSAMHIYNLAWPGEQIEVRAHS